MKCRELADGSSLVLEISSWPLLAGREAESVPVAWVSGVGEADGLGVGLGPVLSTALITMSACAIALSAVARTCLVVSGRDLITSAMVGLLCGQVKVGWLSAGECAAAAEGLLRSGVVFDVVWGVDAAGCTGAFTCWLFLTGFRDLCGDVPVSGLMQGTLGLVSSGEARL